MDEDRASSFKLGIDRNEWQKVLTDNELVFLGKKINFLIPISEINVIQPFVAKGGTRTYQVCDINYNEQNNHVILMGVIGLFAYPLHRF